MHGHLHPVGEDDVQVIGGPAAVVAFVSCTGPLYHQPAGIHVICATLHSLKHVHMHKHILECGGSIPVGALGRKGLSLLEPEELGVRDT